MLTSFLKAGAEATGLNPDDFLFTLLLFSAYPLGLLHTLIFNPTSRHIYGGGIGLLFCFLLYGWDTKYFLFDAAVCYGIMMITPRLHKLSPILVSLVAISYLSAGHLYRLFYMYLEYRADLTIILMMMTVKITSLSFAYYDGLRDPEKLSKQQAKYKVTKLPSILEYTSFLFFYGACLAGPVIEYQDYIAFVEKRTAGDEAHASRFGPAMKKLAFGFFLGNVMSISNTYPVSYMMEDAFLNESLGYRLLYLWVSPALVRLKYYSVWNIAEGGCNLAGLGFNGYKETADGKKVPQWDGVTNIHIFGVEGATCVKELTAGWNIGVSNWLKHYVYFRVDTPTWLPISHRSFSNLMTKLVSAFWHGFYSGYYLFFVSLGIMDLAGGVLRKRLRHFVATPSEKGEVIKSKATKFIYDLLGWVITSFTISYLGVSFVVLRATWTLQIWSSFYYFGHVGIVAILVSDKFLGGKKKRVEISPSQGLKKIE